MSRSLYRFWDLVIYAGQLWRVVAIGPDGLYLRSPGWEYGWGWWGWDGYGRPVVVATVVNSGASLLYHA